MFVATRGSHAAYGFRNVTVTVLPFTATLLMSSQPSRDVMSQFLFMIAL